MTVSDNLSPYLVESSFVVYELKTVIHFRREKRPKRRRNKAVPQWISDYQCERKLKTFRIIAKTIDEFFEFLFRLRGKQNMRLASFTWNDWINSLTSEILESAE